MPSYVPYLTDGEKAKRPKVLIILHQEASTPGRVGHALVQRGFALDIRKPCVGDPLPETMDDHCGAVIFGGPQSANDEDDYIRAEIDWLDVPLRENKPYLGLCLGAQMLAHNLGAEVTKHPEGLVEIGYYPITPTEEGKAFIKDWPNQVYHFHREGNELPRDAKLLATNNIYPCQAFQVGKKAYGFQFHPEVNLAMMNRWSVKGAHRFSMPGAQHRAEHLEKRAIYDAAVRSWLTNFLDQWIGHAK